MFQVCSSLTEWEELINTLSESRNQEEKKLLSRVSSDIFPYVSNKFQVHIFVYLYKMLCEFKQKLTLI